MPARAVAIFVALVVPFASFAGGSGHPFTSVPGMADAVPGSADATTPQADQPGAGRIVAAPSAVMPAVAFAPAAVTPAAPGVTLIGGPWSSPDGPQNVRIVDVDPGVATTRVVTSRPVGGVRTLQTVGGQAARVSADGNRVVAAINGDTWSRDTTTGLTAPTGLQIRAGEVLSAAPGLRSAFGIDASGQPRIGDVAFVASLSIGGGAPMAIDRVNKPRRSGLLHLFTRQWGMRTGTAGSGVEVVLKGTGLRLGPSGTWTATVAAVSSTGYDTTIPTGGWVLSASGTDAALIKGLRVGGTVTVTTSITPGWESVREAVSGRDWLVRGGALAGPPTAPNPTVAQPRSAIGIRADGHLLVVAVDGRQPATSAGVTFADLADLLLGQGAVDAVSLDGGGSTTIYERVPGDVEATLANVPSDGHERAVANALLVVSTVPTGPASALVLRPAMPQAVVGQTVALRAAGVDAALNGVVVAPASVSWSATGEGGVVRADGLFRATAPGGITLKASSGAAVGSMDVTVIADTFAPVAVAPSVVLRTGATAATGDLPLTVSWSATDVGTGVAGFELERRDGAGTWAAVPLRTPLTRSVGVRATLGAAVTFRVRATDRAGNTGDWKTSAVVAGGLRQETGSGVRYAGTWGSRSGSIYLAGAARASRVAGATVSYSFIGRGVAWIAPKGPTEGSATVSVDGVRVATVSLYASSSVARRVVFSRAWTQVGRHTLTIRVAATPGHPWVVVDGFATLDNAAIYPTLIGAGDIAYCTLTGDSATAALLMQQPGIVMAAGDLAYPTGSATQFRDCYGPTWGQFKSRTRPVPGNHEYLTAGAAPYFAYFGSRAGTAGRGWYAYDMGNWRVYALNSNCSAVGGCGEGSPQELWLKADLAANPRACVAAYWHDPRFSSGVHGSSTATAALWNDLYAAGADVIVNGHDHDYERFAPQAPDGTADASAGIREFVVGTGGAELRAFGSVRANSEIRMAGVHGVLRLTLQPDGYAWRFIAAGSTWTDTGSAACH